MEDDTDRWIKYHMMTRFRRLGSDSTKSFKYILPFEVYNLINYTVLRERDFLTEFYTDKTEYNIILDYLHQAHFRNITCEYEQPYECYCIEVVDPEIFITLRDYYDPYNFVGEDIYIQRAITKGYNNIEEIKKDYKKYLEYIGRKFEDVGLLNKNIKNRRNDKLKNRRNDKSFIIK